MILGIVVAPVVMTAKHAALAGEKVLVVRPTDAKGIANGALFMAIDRLGAGEGDRVMVLREGSGVRQILGWTDQPAPIRSMVVGIVDEVACV